MRKTNVPAFELLKDLLVNKYGAKVASGGKEITKRCHVCGDSRNISSRHMYIGISKRNLIEYNCFKCGAGGVVGPAFFRELGEYDDEVTINAVLEFNSNRNSQANYMPNRSIIKTNSGPALNFNNDEVTQRKIAYINNRLGISLTEEDLYRYKIVPDIGTYLQVNNIDRITRSPDVMDWLRFGFVGFLSVNNSYAIMRRVIKKEKLPENINKRYVTYNIYNRNDDMNYYTIPTTINLSHPVNIHMAEGVFDILAICRDNFQRYDNSLFIATCGKNSYNRVIKNIQMNLGLINFKIHIYPDNDCPDTKVLQTYNLMKSFHCGFYIHRNMMPGENDFGVTRERIKENIIVISK